MTNCQLEAYIDMLPAIRAERLLDAAQVALYPVHAQHAPEQASSWWSRLLEDARSTLRQITQERRSARFTFNNLPVSFRELREKLAGALGGGLRG